MAAPSPPHPAVLMGELIEECLLRIPPEEPADLALAALVCRQWYRVVTAHVFRHRYREFHCTAPLLGYVVNLADSIRFVSMSSFRPPHAVRRDVQVIHSCHGHILLRSTRDWDGYDLSLFVWDPITDKQWKLPVLLSNSDPFISNWYASVVCAVGDGCSHLDCHFKVVFVARCGGRTFCCFYSSEADSCSDRIFVSGGGGDFSFCLMGSVLVGDTLYFWRGSSHAGAVIFKYDLPSHQMCTISLQCEVDLGRFGVLIATEDGRLGVANTSNSTLCLWLKEQGRLVESRVIQLQALLPYDALHEPLIPPETLDVKPHVAAFAKTGAGVIFLRTRVGYFTVDLRSGRSKKVGNVSVLNHIVPFVSFCTPAPGTVSTDEGPGATVVVSTDDEPGAGVAVAIDEGPRDVPVSTD